MQAGPGGHLCRTPGAQELWRLCVRQELVTDTVGRKAAFLFVPVS